MPDPEASSFRLPKPRRGEEEFATDLDARLGTQIKQAEQALMAAKADAMRPFGLTVPQYAVLGALYYVPGQSSAQLARMASVTPQTMGAILDKLEAKGWVVRETSRIHRRVLETSLTAVGEDLVLRADEAAREIEQQLGEAFTDAERAELRSLLLRAASVLRNAPPADQ